MSKATGKCITCDSPTWNNNDLCVKCYNIEMMQEKTEKEILAAIAVNLGSIEYWLSRIAKKGGK